MKNFIKFPKNLLFLSLLSNTFCLCLVYLINFLKKIEIVHNESMLNRRILISDQLNKKYVINEKLGIEFLRSGEIAQTPSQG